MKEKHLRFVMLIILGGLLGSSAPAQMVKLGSNLFFTVQDAVNVAEPGDEVKLAKARFYESVLISNKTVTVSGGWDNLFTERGAGETSILDASNTWNTIWVMDSTCTLDGLELVGGNASVFSFFSGGGLLAQRSTVDLVNCVVQSNVAWYGGGCFVGLLATSRVDGTVFKDNGSLLLGGGVFVDGVMQLTNSLVTRNVTGEGGDGAGIFAREGTLQIAASTISDNATTSTNFSDRGGGIAGEGSIIDLVDGVVVVSNRASLGGGLSFSNCNVTLGRLGIVDDVVVRDNAASSEGGGVQVMNGLLTLRGASFVGNSATGGLSSLAYGGGLFADTAIIQSVGGTTRVSSNRSKFAGGGFFGVKANFLLSGLQCEHNEAGLGGGISIDQSNLVLFHSLIQSNLAVSTSGGGVYAVRSNVTLSDDPFPSVYTNLVFEGNVAKDAGGGLFILNSSLTMSNATVRGNLAASGGGLFVRGTSVLYMAHSTLADNRVDLDGGGLWFGGSTGLVRHSVIVGNRSSRDGGGLLMTNGLLRVESTRIADNLAEGNGGGVAAFEGNRFEMGPVPGEPGYTPEHRWASVLQGNISSNSGAAVFTLKTDHVLLDQTAVLNNTALQDALGLYLAFDASVTRCVLAGNHSLHGDAVINFAFHTSLVSRCTLVDNTPYNLIKAENSALSVSNSIVWEALNPIVCFGALSKTNIAYCQAPVPLDGIGNITGAPAFLMDYHLAAESAGIDQGFFGTETDIDGEPVDNLIDIGADEFIDLDRDRLPNWIESGTGIYVGDLDTGSKFFEFDSDGDGINDFDEWFATTDPNNTNDYLRLSRIWREHGTNYVECISGRGVDLVLELNEDPRGNEWYFAAGTFGLPTLQTNRWPIRSPADGVLRVRALR